VPADPVSDDLDIHGEIERIVHDEWGRVVAALMSFCHDLDLAEDALQDAFIAALKTWPERGVPRSPRAWLLKTAQRRTIDRVRRNANFERKRPEIENMLYLEPDSTQDDEDEEIADDRLRLIFTCCHPALSQPAQVALTLKTVAGVATGQIARAFIVAEETMAQRLVRAKRKIKAANIPYAVPTVDLWPERLQSVLAVIYLVYNEGYSATSGPDLTRTDLSGEALRLGETLKILLPREPEVLGLLALMLLHDSRRPARTNAHGELMTLEFQDRDVWNRQQIARGTSLLISALARGGVGPYQIQAAISAVHCEAPSFEATDWAEICLLYEKLYELQSSPIVELNAAVALSFARDANTGLSAIEALGEGQDLIHYQPFHVARADMLRRADRTAEAADAYRTALTLTENEPERDFLRQRLAALS
jgi:RNA polymerase sigma-70 factor (ECF subfamily)